MITCILTPDSDRAEMSHRVYDALAPHDVNQAAECAAAILANRNLSRGIQLALEAAPDLKLEWTEQEAQ